VTETTFATAEPSLVELTTERLEAQIVALAGRRAADDCAWLLLIAEFDRREGWASWECRSTAYWLSWHCGLSVVAAREHVRVGRALEQRLLVRAEFAAGRLTYSKVRAITRVATPANEQALVDLALAATAAQLERICAAYRTIQPPHSADDDDDNGDGPLDEEAQAEADAQHQHLDIWHDEGMTQLRGEIVTEDGAVVEAAIASAIEHLNDGACSGSDSAESPSGPASVSDEPVRRPSRLDGLVEIARTYLAQTAPSPRVERRHLVLLVDVGELTSTGQLGIDPDGRCTLGGHRVTPETARRLGCRASMTTVLIDHRGLPLSVGRRSRLPTPAQRLALHIRDRGQCRYPGCTSRHVDAHHIVEWDPDGLTDLDNLALFCSYHHHLVHRLGFDVALDSTANTVEVRRSDGTLVTHLVADPDDAPDQPTVADDAHQPGEAGTRLDLHDIVESIAWVDTHPEQA
jgi:Domain of unknown function (DUF222)